MAASVLLFTSAMAVVLTLAAMEGVGGMESRTLSASRYISS